MKFPEPRLNSNNADFRRILSRNVALPLAMSAVLVAIFLGILLYLSGIYDKLARYDHAIKTEREAVKLIIDAETGMRGFLINKKPLFLQPYNEAQQRLPAIFDELEAVTLELTGRSDNSHAVAENYHKWDDAARGWVSRPDLGRSDEAQRGGKAQMDFVRSIFNTMETNLEAARSRLSDDATRQARLVALLATIATLLLGLLIAVTGRRQLLALSKTYEDALAIQAAQNAQLTDANWVRTGLTELNDTLRGELDASKLGSNMVEFFSRYIGADLGAVYVTEGARLKRVADIGLAEDDKKSLKSEFGIGEGLVGLAASAKKLQTHTNIPEDYFRISSGTGASRPRHLAILPAIADGMVNGVVELAFFNDVSPRAREMMAGASESLGLALRSMVYRSRLQESLEESQQLSEELQAQQEELRVSNEELEERTNVLQEAQGRLESQHAELEQTNEQLEETATELEEQKRSLDDRNRNLLDTRRDLEAKAEELTISSRYKSEFLANMSHELRTPLNSALILAKLLADNTSGNLTDEQVEFASTIHSAGNDLLNLINDILDLSKVEAGKIDVVAENIPLSGVLESMNREFRVQAERKGIELRTVLAPGAPLTLRTDRQRLEQVLRNLIGNAMKFTSRGFIEITVEPTEDGGGAFRVRDTGIGIDPSQHAAIFEAFRQADGTTSRKYGGTGLGLSISSRLAQLLGGTIALESVVGKGSTFSLVLPAEVPAVATPMDAPPAPSPVPAPRVQEQQAAMRPATPPVPDDREVANGSGKRIVLIVEDDNNFARTLVDLAHENGFQVVVTNSVNEGESLAMEWMPVAIVLDMMLPDGSGLSLLDRMKINPKIRHIPVHGLSANDYSREALNHGAAAFSVKSSQRKELQEFFLNILQKLENRVKRILLVEDDQVQVKAVTRLIGDQGVEIVPAFTGAQAVELLSGPPFDCMIMDLKLPDMSGLEILDRATRDRAARMPPVIVYTGKDIDRAEEEALLKHSRSIIIKGARSPERLLEEVTLFLHRADADLSVEQRNMLRTTRNRERAFEGRTIFVVDDDVRNVFALTNALEQKGAKAVIARNGREAVEKMEAQGDSIDIILMDVMMPEMDGLEATRRIRAGKVNPKVPIIAVTAKAMTDDYERCLQAGANDYLAKPVNVDRLVSLIRVWLPKRMGGL
jgi:signal transduction histidine kinase/DNA-binding response OmpR family regulator/CHASE3 domain sensor protein